MICLIFVLLISPLLIGSLICRLPKVRMRDSYIYKYVTGFLSILAIWAFMAVPYSILCPYKPFHVLRYSYIVVLSVLCMTRIIIAVIRREKPRIYLSKIREKLKTDFSEKHTRFTTGVFFLIVVFQIFNISYYAPSTFVQDDLFYYSLANDNVYMDQLNIKDPLDGTLIETVDGQPDYFYKFIICPWYAFLSFLAATSHIHSLIISHTLIPGFIVLLIYLSEYILALFLFSNKASYIPVYMMWTTILTQSLYCTYYLFHLAMQIATWGKVSAALVGIPVLFVSVLAILDQSIDERTGIHTTITNSIFLFLLSSGTAMLAASVMMIGSLGLFLLMMVCLWKYRKKEVLIYSFAAEFPLMIQLALWQLILK